MTNENEKIALKKFEKGVLDLLLLFKEEISLSKIAHYFLYTGAAITRQLDKKDALNANMDWVEVSWRQGVQEQIQFILEKITDREKKG